MAIDENTQPRTTVPLKKGSPYDIKMGAPINKKGAKIIARKRHCIPDPLVDCVKSARKPEAKDIETVASQIWHDVHPGRGSWHAAKMDSAERRWCVLAAKLALGLFANRGPRAMPRQRRARKRPPLLLRW